VEASRAASLRALRSSSPRTRAAIGHDPLLSAAGPCQQQLRRHSFYRNFSNTIRKNLPCCNRDPGPAVSWTRRSAKYCTQNPRRGHPEEPTFLQNSTSCYAVFSQLGSERQHALLFERPVS
jgi:hypothetical protein